MKYTGSGPPPEWEDDESLDCKYQQILPTLCRIPANENPRSPLESTNAITSLLTANPLEDVYVPTIRRSDLQHAAKGTEYLHYKYVLKLLFGGPKMKVQLCRKVPNGEEM